MEMEKEGIDSIDTRRTFVGRSITKLEKAVLVRPAPPGCIAA
ncbi:MAG: hypothetical protein OJF52_003329 [Nitrospira sp.]|jgi:hypothetical protein|nr:MAG: hypothetical protein OJF52_003329 [Nitrospira sp.]